MDDGVVEITSFGSDVEGDVEAPRHGRPPCVATVLPPQLRPLSCSPLCGPDHVHEEDPGSHRHRHRRGDGGGARDAQRRGVGRQARRQCVADSLRPAGATRIAAPLLVPSVVRRPILPVSSGSSPARSRSTLARVVGPAKRGKYSPLSAQRRSALAIARGVICPLFSMLASTRCRPT